MSRKTKILIGFLVLFMIPLSYITYTGNWQMVRFVVQYPELLPLRSVDKRTHVPRKSPYDLLHTRKVVEDLQQLEKDLLEVHPATVDGFPTELSTAFEEAYQMAEENMTVHDFGTMTSKLLATLHDAHTSMEAPYYGSETLPFRFKQINGKFYVVDGLGAHTGTEILSIGGVAMETLYESHRRITPSENKYWPLATFENSLIKLDQIKFHGGKVIRLDSGKLATKIKVQHKEAVSEILIEADPTFKLKSPHYDKSNYQKSQYGSYAYSINEEKNYTHIILSSFGEDEDVQLFFDTMFAKIKEKNIGHIIVDLRGNTGGTSEVSDRFLAYIKNEKELRRGAFTIRFSEQASSRRGYIKKNGSRKVNSALFLIPKVNKNSIYEGKLYVLVDGLTFSTATDLAVILSDHDLGPTIGTPTGGSPKCYGDSLSFQLKNSKKIYTISHKIFENANRVEVGTLYPDYVVTYTLDDHLKKRDLEMEKAIELIEKSGS